MIYFQCDYEEGCHPAILKRLNETNLEQTVGYSMDPYCASAREKIKKAIGRPDADVHFLVGGTQTNMTVIAAALKPWQGAICADTGHIACHETGAVEATGHKVLALSSEDGKITAAQIEETVKKHYEDGSREHIVQPGMVYISFPTESGTLYSKQELTDIYAVCKAHDMPLFIDGARLGYGLQSPACDVTLPELANLCDVFYIGGTKFDTLFTDGLYEAICGEAVKKAMTLREAFLAKGISMYGSSMTNQQFPILTDAQKEALAKDFAFEYWGEAKEGKSIVRFCTSWATNDAQIKALTDAIAAL